MCRWMAWYGQPLLIDELLYKTQHGLVDQSLHSRMGAETTNGDGFGLGWYGSAGDGPGLYHSVAPAWGDANLRELASHVESPLFLAHVRATSGTAIQQTNCHPFRHGRWLFVHNGVIEGFEQMRRDLMLAVEPSLFSGIQGSTDSEVLFHLALTFGLEDDPVLALERAVGFVEQTAERHEVAHAIQMTIGISDGERLWAFRYATEDHPRTLFVSADATTVRRLHPENPRIQRLGGDDRVIVSEPIAELPGLWIEVPESSCIIVQSGPDEQRPFTPRPPVQRAAPAVTGASLDQR
jgi:predicted glutamine amidotransferase